MQCAACGNTIADGVAVCPRCDTRLAPPTPLYPEPPESTAAQGPYPFPATREGAWSGGIYPYPARPGDPVTRALQTPVASPISPAPPALAPASAGPGPIRSRTGLWVGLISGSAALVAATIVLVGVLAAGGGLGGASLDTPEALGKSIVNALNADDKALFASCYPNRSDVAEMAEKMKSKTEIRGHMLDKWFEELRSSSDRAWDEIREAARSDFVQLASLEFMSARPKAQTADIIEHASVDVIVKDPGGRQYRIDLRGCVRFERGWLLINRPRWRGRHDDLPREDDWK